MRSSLPGTCGVLLIWKKCFYVLLNATCYLNNLLKCGEPFIPGQCVLHQSLHEFRIFRMETMRQIKLYMFSKIKQMLKFLALPLYVPPGNTIIRSNNKHKLRIIIPQDVMLNWQNMLRNQHQYGHDYHEKCERRGIHGPRTQTKTQCTGVGAKRQNVLWSISNSDSQTWNQNKLWWFLVIPFIDYILHIACDEMTSREIVLDCSTRTIELFA